MNKKSCFICFIAKLCPTLQPVKHLYYFRSNEAFVSNYQPFIVIAFLS